MLQTVDVGERSIRAYRGLAPDDILDGVEEVAQPLRGARVLHVNATPYGGGVSELLRSVVPLLNDLGLVADWRIIAGDDAFFSATKALHNGLQGDPRGITSEQKATYIAGAERNAALLEEQFDFVFIHDPQPVAIPAMRGNGVARWIWRCHIDTGEPNAEVWEFLRGYLSPYDAAVFTMREFVPPDIPTARIEIIPPAIDPLSPKNLDLAGSTARQLLDWIGVRLDRPLVTQVSRFDHWKDPLGVIAACRLAREHVRDLQLALVGSMALDDPEGWDIYHEVRAETDADPLMHVFTNITGVGNMEVNAFQRLSEVVVQKSIREGFGLVVSEAMWKGTPVVAGRAGGIPLQMADGAGGILVDGVEECAAAIVRLLSDPGEAGRLGELGRERVRRHFLLPRLLLDELSLVRDLADEHPVQRTGMAADPVCGMALPQGADVPTAGYDETTFAFCSQDCRERFARDPGRYVPPA